MTATDLTLAGWQDWLRAMLGVAVLLLPGIAAADRWLRRMPLRFVWAPVLSLTLLPLVAILLDYVASIDVRPRATFAIALLLSLALGWPRVAHWTRRAREGAPAAAPRAGPPVRSWLPTAVGLAAVLPFLFVAHSLPHLEGAVPSSWVEVPSAFAARASDAATGNDVPYPVHVDEHLHLAHIANIARTGEVEAAHPYTGEHGSIDFFTVGGLRSERGWHVAMAQVHHLSGASLPTLAHFLPALWATYLGLALWATLRPAPGALMAAAFTAVLPTTLRFLGPGFLVPSAFALPWVLAVLAVAHRGNGPGRLVALAILVTGGFFMHIVFGTLALAAGLLAALLRPVPWRERVGLVGALLLPMVWILPASWQDAEGAVTTLTLLPFQVAVFRGLGTFLLVAAVAGGAFAWYRPGQDFVPHRVLSVLALAAIASIAWSIEAQHSNDATYSRLIPPLFLCLAALAGLGVGAAALALRWRTAPAWRAVPTALTLAVAGLAAAAILAHPLQARMQEPYYRVFDEEGWQALEDFRLAEPGSDAVFLSHPWRAPMYNALTGAKPWTVLYPGAAPVNGEDFGYYVDTNGASEDWLRERGIAYVVHPVSPQAPHQRLGPQVFSITNATN